MYCHTTNVKHDVQFEISLHFPWLTMDTRPKNVGPEFQTSGLDQLRTGGLGIHVGRLKHMIARHGPFDMADLDELVIFR